MFVTHTFAICMLFILLYSQLSVTVIRTSYVFVYLRESEKASTPNLDRLYPPPMIDSLPSILAMFTTLPWPLFSSGRNWRVTSITPIRFTSKTFVKSSKCIHSSGPMGTDLPALFTRPHRPAEERWYPTRSSI